MSLLWVLHSTSPIHKHFRNQVDFDWFEASEPFFWRGSVPGSIRNAFGWLADDLEPPGPPPGEPGADNEPAPGPPEDPPDAAPQQLPADGGLSPDAPPLLAPGAASGSSAGSSVQPHVPMPTRPVPGAVQRPAQKATFSRVNYLLLII